MQLVTLDKSQFSGALVRIPSRDLTELEPDWEVDPAGLIIMDKLGKHAQCTLPCQLMGCLRQILHYLTHAQHAMIRLLSHATLFNFTQRSVSFYLALLYSCCVHCSRDCDDDDDDDDDGVHYTGEKGRVA